MSSIGKTFHVKVSDDFAVIEFVSKVIWTDGEHQYKFENGVTLYNYGSAEFEEVES